MTDDTETPAAPATRLAARRVLVTGGTSGLGLAMASALAAAGASVALTGRSADRVREAAASLPGTTGLGLDVRDETSVRRGVEEVAAHLDGIDMLVNNAGIGMRTVNPRSHPDRHGPGGRRPRPFAARPRHHGAAHRLAGLARCRRRA
jgi:NAD(P)-dependent dehydrogenase (short-subunit alcohol dehydrogenase family)